MNHNRRNNKGNKGKYYQGGKNQGYGGSIYKNEYQNNTGFYNEQRQTDELVEVPSDPVPINQPLAEREHYLLYPGEIYKYDSDKLNNSVFKIKNGNLLSKKTSFLFPSNNNESITIGKIYTPRENDIVLGVVTQKFSESFRIDIGAYTNAILNKANTEGNKNSKLDAEVGDLLLCKVISVNPNDAPLLSTQKIKNRNELNVFCEFDLGKLKEGNIYDLPLGQIQYLTKSNPTIKKIKSNILCKIVACNNGKIYINTDNYNTEAIPLIYELIVESLKNENKDISNDIIINRLNELNVSK